MVPKDNWKIGLKNAALVTIDLQRAFLQTGAPVECAKARDFLPKVNELTRICREVGIPVIHVYHSHRADLSDIGLLQEIRPRTDSELENLEGRKGTEFYKDLDVKEDDYVVKKIRYSAFISGSSSLERLLRGLGRDSLIICGVVTDVCVATTIVDAMMLDFRVFLVGDLTTTLSEERQKVALEVLDRHFAKTMTFEEVHAELKQLAAEPKSG